MAYRVIPIPGYSTSRVDSFRFRIIGQPDTSTTFIITYAMDEESDGSIVYGEIKFTDVLEFRWITESFDYTDFPQDHTVGVEFRLVEMLDSAYKENMLSKNMFSQFAGQRLGHVIQEDELRHFYLDIYEYGSLHVLALRVSVRKYKRKKRL